MSGKKEKEEEQNEEGKQEKKVGKTCLLSSLKHLKLISDLKK